MLTVEQVREVLNYDQETGVFTWRVRVGSRALAGNVAGSINGRGYLKIELLGRPYQAHRLAWLIMTGNWPESDIDHINGRKDDNRWVNLRAVTHQKNMKNQPMPSTNTSGVLGVSWDRRDKKWRAQISAGGKKLHLGCFAEFEDAVSARKAAEITHGYHPNHGRQKSAECMNT